MPISVTSVVIHGVAMIAFCAACGRPLRQNLSEQQDAVVATVNCSSQLLESAGQVGSLGANVPGVYRDFAHVCPCLEQPMGRPGFAGCRWAAGIASALV